MTRAIASPEPGRFKLQFVRRGPWLPAAIFRPCPIEFNPETFQGVDRYYHLEAKIEDMLVDVARLWATVCVATLPGPFLERHIADQIARDARLISANEYQYLMADRAWLRDHAPHLPEANPRQPIDFGTLQPPEF